MEILLFGQLTEIAGQSRIDISAAADTAQLQEQVNKAFPAMAAIQYIVAVDKKAVKQNTPLSENSQVALLPPFSGG